MDVEKEHAALIALEEIAKAIDHGVTDWHLIDLMPVEVYDALAYALDEVAQLRDEVETVRNLAADEMAGLSAGVDIALHELEMPLEAYVPGVSDHWMPSY